MCTNVKDGPTTTTTTGSLLSLRPSKLTPNQLKLRSGQVFIVTCRLNSYILFRGYYKNTDELRVMYNKNNQPLYGRRLIKNGPALACGYYDAAAAILLARQLMINTSENSLIITIDSYSLLPCEFHFQFLISYSRIFPISQQPQSADFIIVAFSCY